MDIGSILLISAILLLVALYLARPILEGRGEQLTATDRKLSALQARRDQTLMALRDLDLDVAMGKINQEDYESQRAVLAVQGAGILREIDDLEAELDKVGINQGKAVDSQVQDESQFSAASSSLETQLEAEIRAARNKADDVKPGFCTQCGSEIIPSDRFCSHCGASLHQERTHA